MGVVNWKQVAQDGDGWRRASGEALFLLDGGNTEEEEDDDDDEEKGGEK
jgi:hypothetical protein